MTVSTTVTAQAAPGRTRELIEPLLRTMVNRLDPSTRLVVSYQFGRCDTHGAPVNVNGGKAVRPGLALMAAEAAVRPGPKSPASRCIPIRGRARRPRPSPGPLKTVGRWAGNWPTASAPPRRAMTNSPTLLVSSNAMAAGDVVLRKPTAAAHSLKMPSDTLLESPQAGPASRGAWPVTSSVERPE